MYLVELDTLQCQLPYTTVSIGGSFRCALECHEQCTEHGCLKVFIKAYFFLSYLDDKDTRYFAALASFGHIISLKRQFAR